VRLALGTARGYAAEHPDSPLEIGDLDAPALRHEGHNTGRDIDLYLPQTMMSESRPGSVESNYGPLSPGQRALRRGRVASLARILAICAQGRLRIYYNDAEVRSSFLAWFRSVRLETPFGEPMRPHNPLHDFHFHVTVAHDLEI
jgi:hypothetical protein